MGTSDRVLRGRLSLSLLAFGAPLALGMALQTAFNLVDAFLVAQLPAEEVHAAVGAIGLCDLVAALGTIVSYGVSTASAALIAQRRGAGDEAGVRDAVWQSLLVVAGLAVLFGLFGAFGSRWLVVDVVGAKGAVAAVAVPYLQVMVGGSFSIFLLLQLTTIQRALGSAKLPSALLVLGNAMNVVLAAMLLFGPGPAPSWLSWATSGAAALGLPRMGMVGAAWATVLARTLVLVPNLLVVALRFRVLPRRGARAPKRRELATLARIAWPSSTQLVVRVAAMLLTMSLVARAFTTEADQTATVAMGLVFRVDTMTLFVAMGWGSAAQTFVGQALGAKDVGRAKRAGWLAAGYQAITGCVLAALAMRYGRALLAHFDPDPAALAVVSEYLSIVAPSYVVLGVAIVLGNAIAGAGATRTALATDLVALALVQAPLSWLAIAGESPSLAALFAAVAATAGASALAYAVVYADGRWMRAHAPLAAGSPASPSPSPP